METARLKVLYIAGWGRSGSTILGNVLNELNAFFHVGELVTIWENGLLKNRLCGCGVPFRNCSIWQRIFESAFGGFDAINAQEMCHLRDSFCRNRHVPYKLLTSDKTIPDSHRYLQENLGKLYLSILDVTQSRVIVDGSKSPSYAYLLRNMEQLELYIIHLVRDSRASAYSWSRKVLRSDAKEESKEIMEQFKVTTGSFKWATWNATISLICRSMNAHHMFLRYEDFMGQPHEHTNRILRLIGEYPQSLPLTSDHSARLGRNHTVWGNPSRMQTGTVKLRVDDEWKSNIDQADYWLVTGITWPLLLKYKYL